MCLIRYIDCSILEKSYCISAYVVVGKFPHKRAQFTLGVEHIYCHLQTDCLFVSQLLSVVRPSRFFKQRKLYIYIYIYIYISLENEKIRSSSSSFVTHNVIMPNSSAKGLKRTTAYTGEFVCEKACVGQLHFLGELIREL